MGSNELRAYLLLLGENNVSAPELVVLDDDVTHSRENEELGDVEIRRLNRVFLIPKSPSPVRINTYQSAPDTACGG